MQESAADYMRCSRVFALEGVAPAPDGQEGKRAMGPSNSDVSTGLQELDDLLHGLLVGDNVVWQVDELEDYVRFVTPFWKWAVGSGRRLVYFRFAKHEALVPSEEATDVFELDPEAGFESFLGAIHQRIEEAGRGACYVFDCLSELAVDWFSDEMLANFFRLTCPYLYDMETVAYFAVLRNRHSHFATTPIRETTQILLDVYRHKGRVYLRPVKVQLRHSPARFVLHEWNGDDFRPVVDSHTCAEIFDATLRSPLDSAIGRMDIWHRAFIDAEQELLKENRDDQALAGLVGENETFRRLLRMIVSRDERVLDLAERYFSVGEILGIAKRTIGTGLIGGKAVGMLLSRAILTRTIPRWGEALEVHDSFYVGSNVFFSYVVRNGCWWIRQQMKEEGDFLQDAQEARRRIITGSFSPEDEAQFAEMLDHFGEAPILVRSSSLMEDNFGNSFAGKYESVFCANQGSQHQRLRDFIAAAKTVYASAISEDALAYRARYGLLEQDEQMALLVQRVSGLKRGPLFHPHLAGVGFSYNLYVWSKEIDPRAGMLRLVYGLGTRAVDPMDDDHTRLVALNAPQKLPQTTDDGEPLHTQRRVDVIDLNMNQLTTKSLEEIVEHSPQEPCSLLEPGNLNTGSVSRRPARPAYSAVSFKRLLSRTSFVEDMREILTVLEEAYRCPVDIEFTANFLEEDQLKLNIVQCRPLHLPAGPPVESLPETVSKENKVLQTNGPVIGRSRLESVEHLIYVVPAAYASLPVRSKHSVARLIGELCHHSELKDTGTIMLLGPGRWGTSSASLGVSVSFSEIETVTFLCEIVEMHEGLVPDVSFGTHFFSEMVEMDMLYMALRPGAEGCMLNRDFFERTENRLCELAPERGEYEDTVRVIRAADFGSDRNVYVHANTMAQEVLCYLSNDAG